MLHWKLTTQNLSSPILASILQVGARGKTGPWLVRVSKHTAAQASGTIVLTQAQVTKLLSKSVYINVETSDHPGGEIRGQLVVVTNAGSTPTSGGGSSGGSSSGGSSSGGISGGGHVSHVSHSSHVSHASHSSHFSSG